MRYEIEIRILCVRGTWDEKQINAYNSIQFLIVQKKKIQTDVMIA